MRIYYSPRFQEISQGRGHPESPKRLGCILDALRGSSIRYELCEPKPAEEKDLLLVHTARHIESLKRLSMEGASLPDNEFHENTFGIARLAAGAAWQAAEAAMEDGFSFALVRPPGHHAGADSFGGFCYINNLAFAVRRSGKRTLIIDMDVHHGNGTEDIFKGDEEVLFLSLHQVPLFPGTGYLSVGNIINVPLREGIGDDYYLWELKEALQKVKGFRPELVAISAGFDTYARCQLAGLGIEKPETYREIGRLIRESFSCPIFATLEGGYAIPDLGQNVVRFLEAFVTKAKP